MVIIEYYPNKIVESGWYVKTKNGQRWFKCRHMVGHKMMKSYWYGVPGGSCPDYFEL